MLRGEPIVPIPSFEGASAAHAHEKSREWVFAQVFIDVVVIPKLDPEPLIPYFLSLVPHILTHDGFVVVLD